MLIEEQKFAGYIQNVKPYITCILSQENLWFVIMLAENYMVSNFEKEPLTNLVLSRHWNP